MRAKPIAALLSALLFNTVMGALTFHLIGLPTVCGIITANLLSLVAGQFMPRGAAMTGVYTEIWTGELVKALRGRMAGSWLDGIPDASSIVNNDAIHLVDVGVDPDVLVDNTTYPIPMQKLDDKDITVQLKKFQTKVTPVTDDELYALSYDKMTRVKEAHANAIADKKFAMAAHALAQCTDTYRVGTTGDVDITGNRRKATVKDIIELKRALDAQNVPAEKRRLVLCPDHVNDLLNADQSFREQYNINRADGTIGRLYGFDIYEYGYCPVFSSMGEKQTFGTKSDNSKELYQASFAFYTPRVFKATGSTKMYYSEAATDPESQQNKINFRHYFMCMPKKTDAAAVLVSGDKRDEG